MGSTIILQILPLIFSLVLPFVACWLGLRSQRIQALREYVADTVRDKYPALSYELTRNVRLFDDFLENPREKNFNFGELDQFYDEGLNILMKKYHNALFLSIDYLKQNIVPKLHRLNLTVTGSINRIYDVWISELRRNLPSYLIDKSENIAHDLIQVMNTPNYIFQDLLFERNDEIRKKIEKSILTHTAPVHKQKPSANIVIHGLRPKEYVDYDKVFNSLLETAKPEISKILELYGELQKEMNEKVKELLPLLHNYISNPI
jgi:hypothetical protein